MSAVEFPYRIGVLALQGDYDAHQSILASLGASVVLVRSQDQLDVLDGLILPGGESTVMSRLCDRYGLTAPLKTQIAAGLPVLGTCAGLIFLAKSIAGASANFPQTTLGALDVDVARNAYGAQIESFETDVFVPALNENVRGVFIRAPQIQRVGPEVEILALCGNQPVAVRCKGIIGLAFHPEIAHENRLHRLWLEAISRTKTENDSKKVSP